MQGENIVYVSDCPIANITDFFEDNLHCNQIRKLFFEDESAIQFAREMRNNGFYVVIQLNVERDE